DPVFVFLDRIGRANLRARRIVAVPANIGRSCDRLFAVDEVEVDHRYTAVGVALLARPQTRLAADTARRIDIEFHPEHQPRPPFAFAIRHAETLNSGILLRGSSVRCVNRLALLAPGQW